MKKRNFKTIVGIVAVFALVGMNLFHAWNDYGIKDSSRLLSINASPAEDTTSVKCETKPGGGPVVAHKKEIKDDQTKDCPKQHVLIYYNVDSRGFETIVAYEYKNIATGKTDYIKYTYGYCDLSNYYVKRGEDICYTYKLVRICCNNITDLKECCFPINEFGKQCDELIKETK
ncbi:MAG: hypothetical protein K2N13_04025 [Paraprevotella sp.]|nr:hypothetical protein [Paraprevotella sp.]